MVRDISQESPEANYFIQILNNVIIQILAYFGIEYLLA